MNSKPITALADVTALRHDTALLLGSGPHPGLLQMLGDLLSEPVADAPSGRAAHRKVVGSPAPWHTEAADVLTTIHAGTRDLEDTLRYTLGFQRRYAGRPAAGAPLHDGTRGSSITNTVRALQVIPDLAAAAGEPHCERAAKAVAAWVRAAQEVRDIDQTEPWTPIRRVPGSPPPACPFCGCYSLRMRARAGQVRCTNPDCADSNGSRPQARVHIGAVSGEGTLLFGDDTAITFAPEIPDDAQESA